MSIGMGMGLRAQNNNSAGLRANSPSLNLDFIQQRYSMSLISKAFADIFTFSRASAATRINAAGVMESVAANQPRFDYDASGALLNRLTWSNDLTNAVWTKSACSVSKVSTTLPDGSTGLVNRVTVDSSTGLHRVGDNITIANGLRHSIGVELKADGIRYVYVNTSGTIAAACVVDLQTGAVSGSGANILGLTCEALGNGWYRVTYNGLSGSTVGGCLLQANSTFTAGDSSFAGNGADGFFVLAVGEFEGSVTSAQITAAGGIPVTTSTSAINPAAIVPKGVMIEEQRTNLISNEIGSAFLIKGAQQYSLGILPLFLYTSASDGQARSEIGVVVPASKKYIGSAFYKRQGGGSRYCGIGIYDGTDCYVILDLDTGAIAVSGTPSVAGATWTGGVVSYGNGIYRVFAQYSAGSTGGSITSFKFGLPSETSNLGTGSLSGTSSVLMGGVQEEEGGSLSSYIPVAGSQVTRAGDIPVFSLTSNSWINPLEGTFFVQVDTTTSGAYSNWIDTSTSLQMSISHTTKTSFEASIFGVGMSGSIPGMTLAGGVCKAAISFGAGQAVIAINGQVVGTVSVTVAPMTGVLHLGKAGWGNAGQLNGRSKLFKYLPKRLSTAQLQALTA